MSAISLDQLLASRDNRRNRQRYLLNKYPNQTLVCMTVVMPGSEKRTHQSLIVAEAAKQQLQQAFDKHIVTWEEYDLQTGYEVFFMTDMSAMDAKRCVCRIEETHPLGRLFDIDVIKDDGIPVSRSAVGQEERRCLLCDHAARWCMRNNSHTLEELLCHINNMVDMYESSCQSSSS